MTEGARQPQDTDLKPALRERLAAVLANFGPPEPLLGIRALGAGNINDTYLVTFGDREPAVLQRINGAVFPEPAAVADNVSLVTSYMNRQRGSRTGEKGCLQVLPARDGKSSYRDVDGGVWRMLNFIENTVQYQIFPSSIQAFEGGRMLGRFHRLLAGFDPARLAVALPGFHDLPGYWAVYCRVRTVHRRRPSAELTHCCRIADRMQDEVGLLEEAWRRGEVSRRVIHGDPKLDNILFDRDTGKAVALIDLDTVSAGLLHYDLGDCLRSFCNPAGERPADPGAVRFDCARCARVLAGYRASGASFPYAERRLVYQGVRLLTFELALRFLTDYLQGDRYFKVAGDEDNLDRALTQFHLLTSIERQRHAIEAIAAAV